MKLHGMLLLGNDMIIPRDTRDLGGAWMNETQVHIFSSEKRAAYYWGGFVSNVFLTD